MPAHLTVEGLCLWVFEKNWFGRRVFAHTFDADHQALLAEAVEQGALEITEAGEVKLLVKIDMGADDES